MDFSTTLILVFLALLLEAFFSGSEIAMISINRIRMQQKAEEGNSAAQSVLDLLQSPEKLFSTTSLGTNLAMVTSSAIFTAFMVSQLGHAGEWAAVLVLSPVILFLGEIVPKMIFQNRPNAIMLVMVKPLNFFFTVFSPAINFFTHTSSFITNMIMGKNEETEKTLSRDQIRRVLSLDSQAVELGPAERKMIHKIFNFGEINAEQCMVPLIHITAIKDTATIKETLEIANESGFSRLPVFHDRMYNLIGILNTFDLIDKPIDESPISDLVRPAHYIPPNKKIDDLLRELQQGGLHMAIVVDEHGGCIGIVTIEDLLEEIVGEIEDEYDKPEKGYEHYADGGYLIEADMEINVINDTLNMELPTGDYETLAGLAIHHLEKVPHPGEQVVVNGYRLTIKEASKRKIQSIIVRKLSPPAKP
ncbi:MAG: hemolysin family protein [Nitrospinae bacterium]|jgi:putative hemolysin|nr:hemolysin family protein [Nitrospinota bacterium]MDA1109008.1 hemolysin family protein [Nitrospinota bacterium]